MDFDHDKSARAANRRADIEDRKNSKPLVLTHAQKQLLSDMVYEEDWAPERPLEFWWHDLKPHGARDVLLREGLIAEIRQESCGTPGHNHPGYLGVTQRGREWLEGQGLL